MIGILRPDFELWKTEYNIIQKKQESLSIFERIKCYFGFYKIEGNEEVKERLDLFGN
jgi:hypothetical protein